MKIEHIRNIIRRRKYRLSYHAELERDADQITISEIEKALCSDQSAIIEDYPNDPRGSSCLILGFTSANRPIHIVCGLGDDQLLIIITVYQPDLDEWIDFKIRKENNG